MNEQRSEDSYIFHDILPAFADYGYPSSGDHENLKIKSDIPIPIGSSYKYPDVVFYAEGVPVLVVESKKEGKSVELAKGQVKSYILNFPIDKFSQDGRPPQYAAVTAGKKMFFYKYERDVNQYGGIEDRLEEIPDVLSYSQLKQMYGFEEEKKPKISSLSFKEVFYQIIAALDIENQKKITPELMINAVQLLYEFLKDPANYVSRAPYISLDRHIDRQRWIRNLLNQYDWSQLGEQIASQFRLEIIRSFQGSDRLNQYITPLPAIRFMAQLVGINKDDKVLDFECGSGGFIAAAVNSDVPLENVRGIDIADLPYFVSKLYLALYFNIKGQEVVSIPIHRDNGLYFWGNDWDVVIGNPAGGFKYDPESDLKDLDKVYENLEKDLNQDGKTDSIYEFNFSIQQAIRSAKVGGRICLILPEGFFTNSTVEFLRKFVAKYCKVKAIVSMPRGVFYKGTTTKSVQSGRQSSSQKMSILFVEKINQIKDDQGVEIDNIDLDYQVFLASVQKPENVSGDDWLQESLSRILEDYREWEKTGKLTENNEQIRIKRFTKQNSSPKNKYQLILDITPKKTLSPRRPESKEETTIPDELGGVL